MDGCALKSDAASMQDGMMFPSISRAPNLQLCCAFSSDLGNVTRREPGKQRVERAVLPVLLILQAHVVAALIFKRSRLMKTFSDFRDIAHRCSIGAKQEFDQIVQAFCW
jgi:hypothetical protein